MLFTGEVTQIFKGQYTREKGDTFPLYQIGIRQPDGRYIKIETDDPIAQEMFTIGKMVTITVEETE